MAAHKLPENKTDDIRGLPVARVKQMRQGIGGKVGQSFRTIQCEINATTAPPFGLQNVDRVQLLGINHSGLDTLLGRMTDEIPTYKKQ